MSKLTIAGVVLATSLLSAAAIAQPALQSQGGGTGNTEMDHSRMGGGQGRNTGPAPTIEPQGGGTGNAEMQHGRMGGGQGAGSPGGGRITGNSGGNVEVEHGHAPTPGAPAAPRR